MTLTSSIQPKTNKPKPTMRLLKNKHTSAVVLQSPDGSAVVVVAGFSVPIGYKYGPRDTVDSLGESYWEDFYGSVTITSEPDGAEGSLGRIIPGRP